MATRRKAEVVSMSSLSKAIDKAFELAEARIDLHTDRENLIMNWHLAGRQIREADSVAQRRVQEQSALALATAVTKSVGVQGQPVVTRVGGRVIVGFIARTAIFAQF